MVEAETAVEVRRRQVIAAAVQAFEAYGPGVTLGRIAEMAGVQRPNLYRQFSNRKTLDEAVLRHAAADLTSRIRPTLTRPGTIAEIVAGVVGAGVAWAAEHPQLYRFIAAQHPTAAQQLGGDGRALFLGEIFEAVQDYLRSGNLDVTVPQGVLAALMGMVDAGIVWWLDHDDETEEAVVERLSRHVTQIMLDAAAGAGVELPEEVVFDPTRARSGT